MTSKYKPAAINYRVLTVLLLVALPALLVVGLVVFGVGRAQLRATFGQQLTQLAERTASTVDAFVFRRTIDASEFALVPTLRQAAAAGNPAGADFSAAQAVDQEWRRLQLPPTVVTTMLENDASTFLRAVTQNDPMYSEILLTDRLGGLVGASNLPTDYYQGDEPWWREVASTRLIRLSDVLRDESAGTYVIEVSVPVYAPESNEFAGVLKVAMNSGEMLTAVSGIRIGTDGLATLIRRDGSVVYSGRGVEPGTPFFAAGLLRESLGLVNLAQGPSAASEADRATDPQFRTYFTAQGADGRRTLVAIAPTQLGVSYPQLPWLVAVSQAEAELFAPLQTQVQYFLLLLAFVALVTVALALWLSIRLAAPPIGTELEMHLVEHPVVHRIDEETA